MRLMVDALKFACEKKDTYPQIGVMVFRIWIVILAFVGIQLAWNLRPFLSDKGEEFKFFRKYEGNFYTAIIYSVKQLVSENDIDQEGEIRKPFPYNGTTEEEANDTTNILNLLKH
jgi:hypothetical protein